MPDLIDLAFVLLLLVVASVFEYVYFWPRFRADTAADKPGTRLRAYRRAVIGQWLFAIGAIAIWVWNERAWSAMRFSIPHGWGLAAGIAFVAAGVALVGLQLWSVLRLPNARRVAARPRLGGVAFMLPRTMQEEGWFLALSATAGFCEELLYRGYLAWFFAPWLGAAGAMALVVAIFGVSHAYQGRKGALKATIAGGVMAAIVLVTGSLIPAMIVHALIDMSGGTTGYLLLREMGIDAGPPASASNHHRVEQRLVPTSK
jgi:membrane protease YdiL (CAAX protease family)